MAYVFWYGGFICSARVKKRTPVYNLNITEYEKKKTRNHSIRFTMSFDYNCLLHTRSMAAMFVKHLSNGVFLYTLDSIAVKSVKR